MTGQDHRTPVPSDPPLLEVEGLNVQYRLGNQWLHAVQDVSFTLQPGETLGLVGESGCGKSTLAYALLRLLPVNARIASGRVRLSGRDILSLPEREMRRIRWSRISMIFQSAMNSLNPVLKVKDILMEALRQHSALTEEQMEPLLRESFRKVGLPTPRLDSYPHELSGGMKQRVVIALSMLCHPDIIIADEPTTALDVVVQDQILARIKVLQAELNFALILISHDVSLIAETCDRVAVMYAGQIVEDGDVYAIFKESRHPYTIGLMRAVPRMQGPRVRLSPLPGQPPDLTHIPPACRFEPRCPLAEEICRHEAPPWLAVRSGHHSLCHFATSARVGELLASAPVP